jgi:hypothetical protein
MLLSLASVKQTVKDIMTLITMSSRRRIQQTQPEEKVSLAS